MKPNHKEDQVPARLILGVTGYENQWKRIVRRRTRATRTDVTQPSRSAAFRDGSGYINPMDLSERWIAGGTIGAVVLVAAVRWLWQFGKSVQVERARELFRLQHERFEEMLVKAASAGGKPRGLVWAGCEIIGDAMLARDAAKRIVALVPVVIRFEPVPGSEMEDVPAAREPRTATALFNFIRGHWHTDGRVVFNLNPAQAVAQIGSLTKIETHH
jgi:hypothetical protein